jgi:hypothetical protein
MTARTFEPVTCTRCLAPRWPFGGAQPADYICPRCRAVLASDPHTVDPLKTHTEAERAAFLARLQGGNRRPHDLA